jgi:predicted amidophosphoribosyltransferase
MHSCIYCGRENDNADNVCDYCCEENDRMERQCDYCCRPISDHSIYCPENESSFAQLMQKGYD